MILKVIINQYSEILGIFVYGTQTLNQSVCRVIERLPLKSRFWFDSELSQANFLKYGIYNFLLDVQR